jgi:chromosome segregation ATPase
MLNRQLNRSATLPPADTSALTDARNELASRQNDYDTALSDQRDAAGSAADTKRMTAESNAHTKRISALQKYVNDAQKRVAELERANAEYGQRVFDETRSREAMSNRYQNRARLGKWTGRGLGAIGLGSLLKSWWDYDTAGKIEGVGDRLRSEAREWSPKK